MSSVPRERRCSRDRSGVLGRRLPPLNGVVPATPLILPAPGSNNDEASSRIHCCSPVQPSPRLWHPDGTGTLGLYPELHTRLSRTQSRMSGRGQVMNTDLDYVIDISRPPQRCHTQRATSCRNPNLSRSPTPLLRNRTSNTERPRRPRRAPTTPPTAASSSNRHIRWLFGAWTWYPE